MCLFTFPVRLPSKQKLWEFRKFICLIHHYSPLCKAQDLAIGRGVIFVASMFENML